MMGLGFGFIWILLFWIGLIVLAVWLIKMLFPQAPQTSPDSRDSASTTAREILDQRYAQGELSPEQYQEMRQTIEQ